MQIVKHSQKIILLVWLLVCVVGRLVPHFPNATPMTSLCLLAGVMFSRRVGIVLMLSALIVSDGLLAVSMGYPIFGSWTFFSYSGFLAMIFVGYFFLQHRTWLRVLVIAAGSSLGFWLWTNLGVWLHAAYYPHTWAGLSACYLAALPFLRSAMMGTLVWMVIFYGSLQTVESWQNKSSLSPAINRGLSNDDI